MSRETLGVTFHPRAPVDLSRKGSTDILSVVHGVDGDLALDSACDLLDALHGALLDIIDESSVSRRVTLMVHATETALALVRSVLDGGEVGHD